MPRQVTPLLTGEQTVELEPDHLKFRFHEINIAIFDDLGAPADSEIVLGSLEGAAIKPGSDVPQAFQDKLRLFKGERSWQPEFGAVESFVFKPVGLNTDYQYQVTILSGLFS